MQTKTMEGLIGAGINMKMTDVPMRVYKEARRKDDFATMERAMGYVGDFAKKSQEYETLADDGMKEDVKAAREEAEEKRQETIENRREEYEKTQERIEAAKEKAKAEKTETERAEKSSQKSENGTKTNGMGIVDTVEISEAGRKLSEGYYQEYHGTASKGDIEADL